MVIIWSLFALVSWLYKPFGEKEVSHKLAIGSSGFVVCMVHCPDTVNNCCDCYHCFSVIFHEQ